MYDKRVIRGNTWALRRLAADALVKTSAEERQQMQERRRQIRQRVQSRLKNEQGGRKGKTSSGSGSIPVSAASSSSSTMRRRRNLTPPNIPSPRESPPLLGTRRSSTILEEEPNFGTGMKTALLALANKLVFFFRRESACVFVGR